ncbi:MAG: hypothetical protein ACI9GW_002423 [Halieaceae bacterium]
MERPTDLVTDMQSSFFTNNPEIVAVILAAFGFFAARLLARVTDRAFLMLERALRRVGSFNSDKTDFSSAQPILRGVVYYSTLFFFLILAVQLLGVDALGEWLEVILGYTPQLILAGLIIISGYILGVITKGLVAGITGEKPQHLLPRMAQIVVVIAAVLTGLGQMAIEISFITDVIVILLTAFVGGLSVAFALGSRQLVANLLARRDLDRYRIGSHIRVDGVEGRVVELLVTGVVVASEEGTTTIPAARFSDTAVLLFHSADQNEPPNYGK